MDLYCVKCMTRTSTDELTIVTAKNNRQALTGKCTRCGTKKFRFSRKRRGGDIAAKLEKLPGWEKYSGENHLPGYNYCGPGTRLDIRLDNHNQPKPGEYPINAIDSACHAHDVAYKSKNLQDRHIADVKLFHALSAIKNPLRNH